MSAATVPRRGGGPAMFGDDGNTSGHDPLFDHLLALSDDIGIFEHADHRIPRREHGYCTDDVARLLVVIAREPDPDQRVRDLGRTALRFVAAAQGVDGRVRNRRDADGRWHGRRAAEDCWGRSLWAFGTMARYAREGWMRQSALAYFHHGAQVRSPWTRSMAFAALGAAEMSALDPDHDRARRLLADAAARIGRPVPDQAWPWPEPRLAYANAVLPEALLAAGDHLGRADLIDDGLTLLRWLRARETRDGHLSPTPVGGSGPDDDPSADGPSFDQQPIEVAAMADACHRAATVTGDNTWLEGIDLAARWFTGDNDVGAVMADPESGGSYDGLHEWGPNLNQGAESTLALVSTLQHARRLVDPNG